jgi:hypothetical protein
VVADGRTDGTEFTWYLQLVFTEFFFGALFANPLGTTTNHTFETCVPGPWGDDDDDDDDIVALRLR